VRVVEQVAQDLVRAGKRQVGHHAEGLAGELDFTRVGLDRFDVRPAAAQPRGQARIELDGDDAPGCSRKLGGQPAGAGAEVDDQVVPGKARVADELGRDRPAEEVLTRSAPRPARSSRAPLGHGPSPRRLS
jgi:hypothetical protein